MSPVSARRGKSSRRARTPPRRASGAGSPQAIRARYNRDAEVVAAATKLFYERGYLRTSVQEVADEVGILKASLYHYIKGKDDLLYRVLASVRDAIDEIARDVAAREDLQPLERLELHIRLLASYSAAHRDRVTVWVNEIQHLSEARRAALLERTDQHHRFMTELIGAAQRHDELDPSFAPQVLVQCIIGTIIWVSRWYLPTSDLPEDELMEMVVRFVLRGGAPDSPAGAGHAD